jgi:hypothetical protein
MTEYHKIENIYARDVVTNKLIEGQYRNPVFKELENLQWVATEKIDGTNIRIIWENNEFRFGGKTDKAQFPKGFLVYLQNLTESWKPFFLEKFADKNVCFYGEGYGAGIQTGGKYRPDKAFILFDILIGGTWLTRGPKEDIASQLSLDIVPIIHIGTLPEIVEKVRGGVKSTFGDFLVEGVIATPRIELYDNRKKRVITKVKTKEIKKMYD